jgi:hypothetical protein
LASNPTRRIDWFKAFWKVTLGVGVLVLVAGLVGPLVPLQGFFARAGPDPGVNFNGTSPYWTDTFSIPPVQGGASIHVVATKIGGGNITIQIVGIYARTSSLPESFTIRLDSVVPSVDTHLVLHSTGQYIVLVTSYSARYSITFDGVWRSLYDFSLGVYWGSALIIAGLVSFYYYRIVRERERTIEREMREGGERKGLSIPYV